MRLRLLPICGVCALALAACGQPASTAGNFKGDAKAVAQTVEDIQRAAQRSEADRICRDFLTKPLADSIAAGPSSCATELDKAIKDVDSTQLDVQAVSATAQKATARVRGVASPKDVIRTLSFEKTGTPVRWRVSALGQPGGSQ